ncbi:MULTISPECIES: hypothetical protein [Flagellimonas]|uniref:Uncharacterized protein n=1 Tax=Flagellimonas hadalis TaxID=2597517 RepID=A0A5N5IVT9_9FLAO|nr:hypothetical protein [Allomuricauda hadalis]KAB5487529.1 hypothetical protein FOT42_011235 [Allomuricauda hadalis]RUA29554.1 MAG: hypothetical protein DSY77_15040 [Bacteroidota bacterium]
MQKYKNLGLAIVIIVIGYNVYDYFKVKKDVQKDVIEECSKKFRTSNPEIAKKVADKYCECVFDNLGEKYKNSNVGAKTILEKEQSIMQDCFDKVKQ